MLPRNHCNETDIDQSSIPVEGTVSTMQGKMIIEKKRKAPGCKDDCGLTYSEYKQMMMRPKDPTRKRRYHHVRHAELENAYGLRFPACFFALYEFALECDPQDPLHCMTKLGMVLTGPFEEWHKMMQYKGYNPPPSNMIHRHMRNRSYYAPPEFQVCLNNMKDKTALGYWRDDPSELPPFIAMNHHEEGRLYAVGPNLMAAVKLWLYRRIGSSSLHTRKCFATVTDVAIKWNIIIERVTYELRERETRCNARSLNTIGICVPVVEDAKGNEIGYRPLEVDDTELRNILDAIENAPNDAVRLKKFQPLQEIMQRVNLANDECDFGMGLEFGISMFAHGSKYFHKMILKILPMAYELLDRKIYAEIIKAHIADRRKTIVDRNDILAPTQMQGPAIGTFRVMEDLSMPVPVPAPVEEAPVEEEQQDPDDYISKIRAKGVYVNNTKACGKKKAAGGSSDWG